MKKIFILFLFSYSFLNAQGPPVGTRWTYTEQNFGDNFFFHIYKPYSLQITADTVVSGKNLKIMSSVYSGTMYMLFENKKIFQYDKPNDRYLLLYDFNKNKGDTVSIYFRFYTAPIDSLQYIIDSTRYYKPIGDSLKIQFVHYIHAPGASRRYEFDNSFLEKVGAYGNFYPNGTTVDPPQRGGIRCYEEPAKAPLKFVPYKCDSTLRTGTQNVLDDHNLILYPTLVHQEIRLETTSDVRHEKYFIYITDALSRVILQTTWLEEETSKVLNTNNWQSGIYFVTLRNESGARSTKKIIKVE